MSYLLRLGDGTRWALTANAPGSARVLDELAVIMRLEPCDYRAAAAAHVINVHLTDLDRSMRATGRSWTPQERRILRLAGAAQALIPHIERNGGLLLHAALASIEKRALLLVGSSGAGKSTASRRLPPPWLSMSDDATLVVGDGSKGFFAHPWPTWSRFVFEGQGGSWPVPHGRPLAAVAFLEPDTTDHITAAPSAETAALLASSAEEAAAWPLHDWESPGGSIRDARVRRFDNACSIARSVPGYHLSLTETGRFWRSLERVLG